MPVERSAQFGGFQRSGAPTASRAAQLGLGLGRAGVGKGRGHAFKRHRMILRDSIHGITKADVRRLARRGGVKRISAVVYGDIRLVLRQRLELILKQAVALVEYAGRKTVTVTDIIFVLNRLGNPVYGFDPAFQRT